MSTSPTGGNKHVRVVVRTRPTSQFASKAIEILPDKNNINVHLPKSEDGGIINNQQLDWSFKFDKVLHCASQDEIFEACAQKVIRSLVEGYNGTIMAYGQTGSGKTYTMTGATESFAQRGLIPRAISQLFREIQDRPQYAFTVRVAYLEIYNETLIDLLVPSNTTSDMTVVEDRNGLSHLIANNEEEALNYLFEGETNRNIGDHALNRSSSRSHTIFTLFIESKSRVDSSDDVIFAKLNLVDLAGSERLAKTHSSGRIMKEAMFINKSLTFLEQVIIALGDKKREHVPYRQSRLTNVLRDSLGGNCNTVMIANIWGEIHQIEETLSTLRFATRMMCVQTDPIVNVQFDPMTVIKKQEREIKELRQELAMHDNLIGRSHVQYEAFTDTQRAELTKKIKTWLDGGEEEIEIVTLRQVKEILSVFKTMYLRMNENSERMENFPNIKTPGGGGSGNIPTERTLAGSLDEEDGVGDSEGLGFSIGVAPNAASGNVKKRMSRKSTSSRQETPSQISFAVSRESSNGQIMPGAPQIVGDDQSSSILGNTVAGEETLRVPQGSDPSVASNFSPLTPLPPIAGKMKVCKNDEFQTFKKGPGQELAKALASNKGIFQEKKKEFISITKQLSDSKAEIDRIRAEVAAEREKALIQDVEHDPQLHDIPLSPELQAQVGKAKTLKSSYMQMAEQAAQLKSEMEYAANVVDSCRQRLVQEYETWFRNAYEAPPEANVFPVKSLGRTLPMKALPSDNDTLDVAECLDLLESERLREDPASFAYYSALKKKNKRKAPTGKFAM